MITKRSQYADIPFFISPNRFTGDLNLVKDLSAIRQSLKNVIMCNKGERPFDFLFGASLYENLFDNLTHELIIDIQTKIATNLKRHENRVDITNIIVREVSGTANTVNITIFYAIPDIGVEDVITIGISRNR